MDCGETDTYPSGETWAGRLARLREASELANQRVRETYAPEDVKEGKRAERALAAFFNLLFNRLLDGTLKDLNTVLPPELRLS